MEKRWELREGDNRIIASMADELAISPILARVLYHRNIRTAAAGRHFLFDTAADMADPCLMKDMERAADRVSQAITKNEKIVIYGDYDVDGVTSTALLCQVLRELGAAPDYYIPARQNEGYGLHADALEKLAAEHTALLITVDCGISSYEEVSQYKDRMDIIISDHHEPPALFPPAYAILNPKQAGCAYPFKELAGAGVAYKLCQAIWQKLRGCRLTTHMELAALGTIADLVPLTGENRIIAKTGLEQMKDGANIGLQALLDVSGVQSAQVTAGRIAFTAAPRLNAAGRIGHAIQGVKLLLESDPEKAKAAAVELDAMNSRRQDIEHTISNQAIEQIREEKREHDGALVAYGHDWHPGVIGIAASRLVEQFYRPSLVISLHDGIGKGSCRSIAGFNIYDALSYARDTLIQFGGHPMAAGFSITEQNIPLLQDRLNQYAAQHMTSDDYIPLVPIDGELSASAVSLDLIHELAVLEPYGMGNSHPVFALRDCPLKECRLVGKNKRHLRLAVDDGNGDRLVGMGWSMAAIYGTILEGDTVDMAVTLEENSFNGKTTPQMIVQDIHTRPLPIHLDRESMVSVYTSLRRCLSGHALPVLQASHYLMETLAGNLDGHTIFAALAVLQEIGVLEIRDDEEPAFYLPALNEKMHLETSPTFLKFGADRGDNDGFQ